MEVWKNISGYDGDYQVSSEGRIKSMKAGRNKVLKPRGSNFMLS